MSNFQPQQLIELTPAIVLKCLSKAVRRFNKSADQKTLLCAKDKDSKTKHAEWSAANEPAIAHRLAYYLERELRNAKCISDMGPISVDCEYDRHLNGRKKLQADSKYRKFVAKHRAVSEALNAGGNFEFLVFPDIIVHQRLTNSNYLVVELKKRTRAEANGWEVGYDDLKLSIFTKGRPNGYGYELGAWVVAEDMYASEKRCLRIARLYSNGKQLKLKA
jgi:hypothetical protein